MVKTFSYHLHIGTGRSEHTMQTQCTVAQLLAHLPLMLKVPSLNPSSGIRILVSEHKSQLQGIALKCMPSFGSGH